MKAINDLDLRDLMTDQKKKNMALQARRNSFYRTLKNVEPDLDDLVFDRGATANAQNKWLFEIAWEVANKGNRSFR